MKVLLLNSNKLTGKLDDSISNLTSLQRLSLFENNFSGRVPLVLENLNNLKELNISFNNFEGFVSTKLAKLDVFNMKMINEKGQQLTLKTDINKNNTLVSEE